jgi:hypothetical protein
MIYIWCLKEPYYIVAKSVAINHDQSLKIISLKTPCLPSLTRHVTWLNTGHWSHNFASITWYDTESHYKPTQTSISSIQYSPIKMKSLVRQINLPCNPSRGNKKGLSEIVSALVQ